MPAQGANSPDTLSQSEAQQKRADILATSRLPALVPEPLAGDPMRVTVHRLSNGLSVYLSPDPARASFSAWIAVRAGSRHDPANSTGLAHYLEHMLFKGTNELGTLDYERERPHLEEVRKLYRKLRDTQDDNERQQIFKAIDAATQLSAETSIPNEIDRVYKTLGIQGINAFTSDEMTVYIADVPSNRLEQWATIESERFRDPSFRLFYPELEAVYEEKNLSIDNPAVRIDQALMRGLFPKHPYGTQPTIGTVEHLKTPAFDDMVAYFERWYRPNNMALVIAGDIDADTIMPVLERHFGSWQPQALGQPEPGTLEPLSGRVFAKIEAEGRESVTLAWPTVPVGHPDEHVLEVMDWLMANGQSGLFETKLELPQRVLSAGSLTDTRNEAGYWEVRATARSGQTTQEVEDLVLEVIAELARGEFDESDIDSVILDHKVHALYELESNASRVSKMSMAFLNYRNWSDVVARDQAVAQVRKSDIMRVANRYIGPNYVAVHRVRGEPNIPKIAKPEITPVEIDPSRKSAFAQRVTAMGATPMKPQWLREGEHYQRRKGAAGPIVLAHNPRNQLFSLVYRFDLGHRKSKLLCHALDVLERSGSGSLDAAALQRRLYALGTAISFACTGEASAVQISGLDENFESSLQAFRTWLDDPNIDAEIVKASSHTELSRRRDQVDDPASVARALTAYAQYGKRSPWLLVPSNKQIVRAKAAQLVRLIRKWPNHKHHTSYFGPRKADEVVDLIALGRDHAETGPRRERTYRKVGEPTIFVVDKRVAKSTISIIFPNAPLADEDRGAAELFGDYLGGNMSSLIFQEIRESRGLAYTARCAFSSGSFPGDQSAVVGAIATQVDKTPQALGTFIELLESTELDPTRFSESKSSLIEAYRAARVDPRTITTQVLVWDRLKLSEDPRPARFDQIQALSLEEVLRLGGRLIDRPFIVAITGDRERLDLPALKKLGKVREITAKTLFSYGRFPKLSQPNPNPNPNPNPASSKAVAP